MPEIPDPFPITPAKLAEWDAACITDLRVAAAEIRRLRDSAQNAADLRHSNHNLEVANQELRNEVDRLRARLDELLQANNAELVKRRGFEQEAAQAYTEQQLLRNECIRLRKQTARRCAEIASHGVDGHHLMPSEIADAIRREFSLDSHAPAEPKPAERTDGERLDWLERVGFSTTHTAGTGPKDAPGVHCWSALDKSRKWTAHWIGSEFPNVRAAIDAAMDAEASK